MSLLEFKDSPPTCCICLFGVGSNDDSDEVVEAPSVKSDDTSRRYVNLVWCLYFSIIFCLNFLLSFLRLSKWLLIFIRLLALTVTNFWRSRHIRLFNKFWFCNNIPKVCLKFSDIFVMLPYSRFNINIYCLCSNFSAPMLFCTQPPFP